jgi:hypothetical protein
MSPPSRAGQRGARVAGAHSPARPDHLRAQVGRAWWLHQVSDVAYSVRGCRG